MTETVSSPGPTTVRRVALGVASGFVLAALLLTACGGETDNFDVVNLNTITVNQHLYLKGGDGAKFEISVVKDASGKDVVTATRVGQ